MLFTNLNVMLNRYDKIIIIIILISFACLYNSKISYLSDFIGKFIHILFPLRSSHARPEKQSAFVYPIPNTYVHKFKNHHSKDDPTLYTFTTEEMQQKEKKEKKKEKGKNKKED